MEPPIRFEQAGYKIGDAVLLKGLDVEVLRGETLMLLGRSGAGKTTALRLINRLIEPSEGRVTVEGRETAAWDPVRLRRRIGYVIQETGLFPHFTAAANAAIVPRLEGWAPQRIARRVSEVLSIVGLDGETIGGRYPDQLSGGQRQRVGVARALAADPPILLMDEPFGALDPITRREIQRAFRGIQEKLRKTVVFVTHDVREALLLGDRIAVMEEGRLVWLGENEEFRAANDPRLAAFLEGVE